MAERVEAQVVFSSRREAITRVRVRLCGVEGSSGGCLEPESDAAGGGGGCGGGEVSFGTCIDEGGLDDFAARKEKGPWLR